MPGAETMQGRERDDPRLARRSGKSRRSDAVLTSLRIKFLLGLRKLLTAENPYGIFRLKRVPAGPIHLYVHRRVRHDTSLASGRRDTTQPPWSSYRRDVLTRAESTEDQTVDQLCS